MGDKMKTRRQNISKGKPRKTRTTARSRESGPADLRQQLDQRTRELAEALERQTATSEVLEVIGSSPTQVQPVFEAMVGRAAQLCQAHFSAVARFEHGLLHLVALNNLSAEETAAFHSLFPRAPARNFVMGRAFVDNQPLQFEDVLAEFDYDLRTREVLQRTLKYRTFMAVPIVKEGNPIGVIGCARREVWPFTSGQIGLVKTFADQAVIAIENARLFEEVQERSRELQESLQQQTATSEVLSIISSSPGELAPVFDAMLANAVRLCEAKFGVLNLWEGDAFRVCGLHNVPPAFAEFTRRGPLRPGPDVPLGRAARTKQVVQCADITQEPFYIEQRDPVAVAGAELGGYRTVLAVPMLKETELIGVIVIFRQEVRPFTDKQIELVSNFAKQAVIAIENARLLNELRQRTDDLSEALEQQTATSEVLKVVSSSPGELDPVFDTMLANAVRICDATFGVLFRFEDGAWRAAAMLGVPPAFAEYWRRGPQRPGPGTGLGRIVETRQTVHIADVRTEPAFVEGEPVFVAAVNLGRFRTVLNVPMLTGERACRLLCHLPSGGTSVHGQADRAGDELRGAGRHCHREHSPAE